MKSFKVTAQDPTNNNKEFVRYFWKKSAEGAEVEANLLFGTSNVLKVEEDTELGTFEQWYQGTYANAGNFEIRLFQLYQYADSANKDKLEAAFPEVFKNNTFR